MKRILPLLLILTILFSLTACLPEGPTENTDPSSQFPTVDEGTGLKEQIKLPTTHTTVSEEDYYQYSFLSASEKVACDRLRKGISEGKNNVDVSDLTIPKDTATRITRVVTADNPQFFYLSKTISYTYNPDTNCLLAYQPMYTDGTAVDTFDGKTFTEAADRNKIDGQIRQFKTKIDEVVSAIPVTATQEEKEKQIHDYIVSHVEYDTDGANHSEQAVLPRGYDAYGALCEGKATCEGYAKLFQYLCYCVGIQCTQVSGQADGGPHMWNALLLNEKWYLTDITWNDPVGNESQFPTYDYYNLPMTEMNKNHVPDATSLHVPECTADDLTSYKNYSLYTNGTGAPVNYESILDRLAAEKGTYVSLYTANLTEDVREYASYHFFDANAPMMKYIAQKGYDFSFQTSFVISGSYIYLLLEE